MRLPAAHSPDVARSAPGFGAPRASSLVRIANSSVEFRDRPDYLIPVARLQTPLQILGCVSHLMTKPWITPEATRAFIEAVCRHRGIRIVETA